jgi:glycerophosphoryl diester phosphodiesterase
MRRCQVPFFDKTTPLVIAHRGLAVDAPENTLPAFHAAEKVGADILETDVHLSRDGQVIISHDPVLDRVAGRPGRISDYTAAELAEIDLGGGVGFPTLQDALTAHPTAKFNIDLKERAVVDAFVDVVTQLRADDRVLAASFDEPTRAAAVSRLEGVATSATRKHFIPGLFFSSVGAKRRLAEVFAGIDAVQAPVAYGGVAIANARFISSLRDIGKQVHFWTINDPYTMRRLYLLGATGVVTDRADLAIEVRDRVVAERTGA